ncbi:hypothetical protein V9T40_005604 [Parthenolecanium corni]|uniref:C2H2-type domain-containing protein n=1 Tax=Parthenolecanium corni TaxID=536013 RepID=A0AAN9U3R5_9HEMI
MNLIASVVLCYSITYSAFSSLPLQLSNLTRCSRFTDARLGRRPCPLCQKIISNKSNLLKHMRIRHSDEYNPAGCTMCGKVFKNKYSLRAHINIYHKETSNGAAVGFSMCGASAAHSGASAHPSSTTSGGDYMAAPSAVVSGSSVDRHSVSVFATASGYGLHDLETGSYLKQTLLSQYNVSNSPLT